VLGATTSGPEALDNLADKGDMQVGCTAGRGGGVLNLVLQSQAAA
jgi:hypothetical protein